MAIIKSTMRSDQIKFCQQLQDAIDSCGKTQGHIADMLGYGKPNIISMFKTGTTRVPMVKVPEFARLVGLNPSTLLRDWFAAFEPDQLVVIEAHFGSAR